MQINVQYWFWSPQQSFWRPCHHWSAFLGHPTKAKHLTKMQKTPLEKPIWPSFWRPLWRPGRPLPAAPRYATGCMGQVSVIKQLQLQSLRSDFWSWQICQWHSLLTSKSRWQFKTAMPLNHSSPIRDLNHVLTFLGVEKLLSALSVLMGIVKSMVKNVWIKGNTCLWKAGKSSGAFEV